MKKYIQVTEVTEGGYKDKLIPLLCECDSSSTSIISDILPSSTVRGTNIQFANAAELPLEQFTLGLGVTQQGLAVPDIIVSSGGGQFPKEYNVPLPLSAGTYTISYTVPNLQEGGILFQIRVDGAIFLSLHNTQGSYSDTFTIPDYAVESGLSITLYAKGFAGGGSVYDIHILEGSTSGIFAPIVGYSDVTISHVGDSESQNIELRLEDSVGTVYGGYYNGLTKELVVTHQFVDFDGSEEWEYDDNLKLLKCTFTGPKLNSSEIDSERFSLLPYQDVRSSDQDPYHQKQGAIIDEISNGQLSIFVRSRNFNDYLTSHSTDPDINDKAKMFKKYLAEMKTNEMPFEAVYPLDTPVKQKMDTTDVEVYSGKNQFTSDSAEMTIEYFVMNPAIPGITSDDNGKVLKAVDGQYSLESLDGITVVVNENHVVQSYEPSLAEISTKINSQNRTIVPCKLIYIDSSNQFLGCVNLPQQTIFSFGVAFKGKDYLSQTDQDVIVVFNYQQQTVTVNVI